MVSCFVDTAELDANTGDLLDRTAQEVAKLTYKDMLELLTMKSQWRRDMERMMAERATVEEESIVESTSNNSTSRLYNVQEICI